MLTSSGAGAASPAFTHVVIIVFENKDPSAITPRTAPVLTRLGTNYARLTNYHAVAHPSLPNYLALVSGSTHGIETDCEGCSVNALNLADQIDASGRTWKLYAEGLPRPGWTGANRGFYARRHVPFLYFRSVASSAARRKRIVPLMQLRRDLARHVLPNLAFVVPNICHDMHDCPVSTGDRWLDGFVPPLLRLPNTVVFVVFDESANGPGSARIPAYALGAAVRPGAVFGGRTGHYGLLRTIEEAWGLSYLGRAANARAITGIWR